MLDSVEPEGVPAANESIGLTCPSCSTIFIPKRTNQSFCSRPCQNNASRTNRHIENMDLSMHHYSRANDLAEMVYSVAPSERLGVMKHILEYFPHDAGLRRILSDPKLLRRPPHKSGRKNIAQAANAYVQKFFGISIKTYMAKIKAGEEIQEVVIKRRLSFGPVPRIKTKLPAKNVKCIHKPLA